MLGIIGGILLVAATPISLLLLSLIFGPLFSQLFGLLAPFACLGIGVNGFVGGLAVKAGLEALKGERQSGVGLLVGGVVGIVAGIFLLGGLVGIGAGILLVVAGALLHASSREVVSGQPAV